MKDTLGVSITRQQMVEAAVRNNYDHEKAIQEILVKQVLPVSVNVEKKGNFPTRLKQSKN